MNFATRPPSRATLGIAGLTLAMHAVMVFTWRNLPPAQPVAGGNPTTLQVRLLPNPEPTAGSSDSTEIASAADKAALAPRQASAAGMTDTQAVGNATGAASTVSIQADDIVPASFTSAAAASPASAALLQRPSDDWEYLSASQLDIRPVMESAVSLPFPEGQNLPRGMRVSAVLVLYVSADGVVDRIEFAQSALPEVFARTAVESFSRVRLRPGIKDGRARRAMMKIEVEFEAPDPAQKFPGTVLQSSRSWQED